MIAGVLKGNGNFIERIAGACILEQGFAFDEVRAAVLRNLSQRVHNHYRGFAMSQRREWDATGKAKKALYVLRTTLTGRWMLLTGEVVTDVTALFDEAGFAEGRELVARKLQGEQTALPIEERARWNTVLDRAFAALDDGLARSTLPERPAREDELDALLVDMRLRTLES